MLSASIPVWRFEGLSWLTYCLIYTSLLRKLGTRKTMDSSAERNQFGW
jgi:hypothetical protein